MSEETILTTLEDGIFTLTFNRPESMNAMTTAQGNLIREAIRDAYRDPDVRAFVITGTGRAFSAGGDMKVLGSADERDPLALKHGDKEQWNQLEMRAERLRESAMSYYMLHTMPKPTIAMINGPAIGAGLSPALACDFRIMSDKAFLNTGYANIGLSGDIGTAFYMVNVLGPAKTRELMMLPRNIDAAEAQRIGLVNKSVPHHMLLDETMKLARQLANGPTLTFGHIKENIQAAIEHDPRVAFDIEARNFIRSFETEDHKEARSAFLEKRKPVFTGR